MPAVVRNLFHVALALAALNFAACASAPTPPQQPPPVPTLPTGATFAQWITTGQANPETFDFSGAGYWRLSQMERIQWRQPTIEAAMRVFTGAVDSYAPESQRQGAPMLWMMLLLQAADDADWNNNATALRARLAQIDVELAAAKPAANSTDPRVAELLARFARDQAVRGVFTETKWMEGLPPLAAKNWATTFVSRMTAIDCSNTTWLKTQLAAIRWFDIPNYGAEADTAAWHLVQHADREPEFQRRMLKELEALPKGHTDSKRIGYLWDRVALADKRLQRYATQGQCADGIWKPFDVNGVRPHFQETGPDLPGRPISHWRASSRSFQPFL